MLIVVCVKHVPDAQGGRRFEADHTLERVGDGLLCELDEYAVEEALALREIHGGEVVALTMGPALAGDALRRALQMGADRGVHVRDDALAGSDAPATSLVLAEAIRHVGAVDLVLTGMSSTDGNMAVVPAMLAERLRLPQLTLASDVTIEGDRVRIRRDGDTTTDVMESSLPAVLSITDQANEPRYPSFSGITAAKRKPVQTLTLADLGIDPALVGAGAAWTRVLETTPRPSHDQGLLITDDGNAGAVLAQYLLLQNLV